MVQLSEHELRLGVIFEAYRTRALCRKDCLSPHAAETLRTAEIYLDEEADCTKDEFYKIRPKHTKKIQKHTLPNA